jgi:hypothetical protein
MLPIDRTVAAQSNRKTTPTLDWLHKKPEMTARLVSLCFDANDPLLLARFWAGTLQWDIADETQDGIVLMPTDETPFIIDVSPVAELKVAKNRIHLDLVSESPAHQGEVVDRLIALGAKRVDIGQPADATHVVLGDPEGNEFCVVLRGEFLATTGFIGAVVFEPAELVTGHFWGDAIGWPLVYDQDGDTAIRAPDGRGPFITFGPAGTAADTTKSRLHLHIAPPPGGDQEAEVERLLGLGAKRLGIRQGNGPCVVMADPDGIEFCFRPPG